MLYCSSECGSISIMQLRTIYCNTHVYTFHVCLCLLALTFVSNSTYLLKCSFQIYQKSNVVFIRSSKVWTKNRIALQVGRKIAPCDRALIHVWLAYLFLHSRQVLSSFKCYFKRKYLNLLPGKLRRVTGSLAHDVVLNHTFELLINTSFFDIFETSISIHKWNDKQM